MKRISPQEAKSLLDAGWTYLDVRSEPEFAQGHPAGAWNVPIAHAHPTGGMVPNPDFLRVVESAWPKDAPLVVGCRTSGRAERACQLLESAGYTQLALQQCGFVGTEPTGPQAGWASAGLPVEANAPQNRCYTDLLARSTR